MDITKVTDMSFGVIAVSGPGAVILAPTGTRSSVGGVSFPMPSGHVSSAMFEVVSNGRASAFSITLPHSYYIRNEVGQTLTLTDFQSFPSTGTFSNNRVGQFTVGATLLVSPNQAAGNYTNPTGFEVIVNYN